NTLTLTTVLLNDPATTQFHSLSLHDALPISKFTINATTGALAFVTAPNFEVPTDAGANNVYDVVVQVADGNGGTDSQAIAVTVTIESELPSTPLTDHCPTAALSLAENTTAGT